MIYIPYRFFNREEPVAVSREGKHGYRVRRRCLKRGGAVYRLTLRHVVDAPVARAFVLLVLQLVGHVPIFVWVIWLVRLVVRTAPEMDAYLAEGDEGGRVLGVSSQLTRKANQFIFHKSIPVLSVQCEIARAGVGDNPV